MIPSFLGEPTCLGSHRKQKELHFIGRSNGGCDVRIPAISLGFANLFVCICLEKEFCLKNWASKSWSPKHKKDHYHQRRNASLYTSNPPHKPFLSTDTIAHLVTMISHSDVLTYFFVLYSPQTLNFTNYAANTGLPSNK